MFSVNKRLEWFFEWLVFPLGVCFSAFKGKEKTVQINYV